MYDYLCPQHEPEYSEQLGKGTIKGVYALTG